MLRVAASSRSLLPAILDWCCRLPVATAEDGAPLLAGHVYVAPPDRRLLVCDDHVALSRGPKENGARPAGDVLFRSLAASHGPAAVAVVVSGALARRRLGRGRGRAASRVARLAAQAAERRPQLRTGAVLERELCAVRRSP